MFLSSISDRWHSDEHISGYVHPEICPNPRAGAPVLLHLFVNKKVFLNKNVIVGIIVNLIKCMIPIIYKLYILLKRETQAPNNINCAKAEDIKPRFNN